MSELGGRFGGNARRDVVYDEGADWAALVAVAYGFLFESLT